MERDRSDDQVGLIIIPEIARRLSARGLCCLHEPNELDEDLTGRTIYFERLAGEPFTWNGRSLELMYEGSALAVDMTGREMQDALKQAVGDQVADLKEELSSDDLDSIESAVDGIIQAARDNDEEED